MCAMLMTYWDKKLSRVCKNISAGLAWCGGGGSVVMMGLILGYDILLQQITRLQLAPGASSYTSIPNLGISQYYY